MNPCSVHYTLHFHKSCTVKLIFALPTLQYNNLSIDEDDCCITMPMAKDKHSPIEYINIDHSFTCQEIFIILSYIPQLHRLKCSITNEVDETISTKFVYIKFDDFEIFIKKFYCKLKVLCIKTESQDIFYLNASRWENLIIELLPNLETLYLQHYEDTTNEHEYPDYIGGANQFISSFWIEHNWIFEVKLGKSICYSVHPYQKTWHEYTNDKILNSFLERTKSTQLTIANITLDDPSKIVPADILRILTVSQIHHLDISDEIFGGTLIILIDLLSVLDTLKIHCLSLHEPRDLNDNEDRLLQSIKHKNKIKKVFLQRVDDVYELSFILSLSASLGFLRIGVKENIKIEYLLSNIINKINSECHTCLRCLCFNSPTADDETIIKLNKMINDEKFLFNYSITRTLDCIYLQWA